MEDRSKKAEALFAEGYNCAQAVAVAYADKMGVSEAQAARIASPFGGGMGKTRGVCGAVSGMLLVQGGYEGYGDPKAKEEKAAVYDKAREMLEKFKAENGSVICAALLGLDQNGDKCPPRGKKCGELVRDAAKIVADSLD
ncbi:MAG TPA: hypothetical protein DEB31_05095 [Clostridiales bacterium]|nr:hypothetical protein [Clostridiales bacterium]